MKHILPHLLLSLACAAPALAQAQAQAQTTDPAAHHVMAQASPAAAAADMATGEVRKVDKNAAKLTLKHGEIRNLDMPPMTMVFNVKDKAVLDQFKTGDKVRFKVVDDAGKYTVTDIELAN
jgi:Cu/Ag efflux protein CusF